MDVVGGYAGNTIGGTVYGAGNVISGNTNDGILLLGTAANTIFGNRIGTDQTGTIVLANRSDGIQLADATILVGAHFVDGHLVIGGRERFGATDNTIGGTAAGAANIISGNTSDGVEISGKLTADNLLEGNQIGTDSTGTVAIANGSGIEIDTESHENTIGGTTVAARNIISGNRGSGVEIGEASLNVVAGNWIGVDATGASALANAAYGVSIQGASAAGNGTGGAGGTGATGGSGSSTTSTGGGGTGTTSGKSNIIGGTTAGSGNVISGNGSGGIFISMGTLDIVAGNWIGTDAAGTMALANAGDGVDLNQTSGNTIGGTVPAATNLISGNTNGVEISDSGQNLVQGNMIGTDTTGTMAIGNSGAGVLVHGASSDNTIGGPVGGARNLISGNAEGVMIRGRRPDRHTGGRELDRHRRERHRERAQLDGRHHHHGRVGHDHRRVGTLGLNLISGNMGDGIDIDSDAANTLVEGNYIGTDQTGTKPLPNTGDGVPSDDASGVTIGATIQSAGNVISGNAQSGVSITGTTTTAVLILGNRIGTDYTGSLPLGNASFGVIGERHPRRRDRRDGARVPEHHFGQHTGGIGLYADATGAWSRATTSAPTSPALPAGQRRTASRSTAARPTTRSAARPPAPATPSRSPTGDGVYVDATGGTGNEIRLNSIFSSTGLGIALGSSTTVTLNNSAGHVGPNDYQNFPVLSFVSSAGGMTTVTGP